MNTSRSLRGLALILVLLGVLITMTATVSHLVTDEAAWNFVVAGGGVVQLTGWMLHLRQLRRRRGGAA